MPQNKNKQTQNPQTIVTMLSDSEEEDVGLNTDLNTGKDVYLYSPIQEDPRANVYVYSEKTGQDILSKSKMKGIQPVCMKNTDHDHPFSLKPSRLASSQIFNLTLLGAFMSR